MRMPVVFTGNDTQISHLLLFLLDGNLAYFCLSSAGLLRLFFGSLDLVFACHSDRDSCLLPTCYWLVGLCSVNNALLGSRCSILLTLWLRFAVVLRQILSCIRFMCNAFLFCCTHGLAACCDACVGLVVPVFRAGLCIGCCNLLPPISRC